MYPTRQIRAGHLAGIQELARRAEAFEFAARAYVRGEFGETVIRSQFQHGAAARGFDFLSFTGSGKNARLFINEVKFVSGRVRGSKFTTFGLGKSGTTTFDAAIEAARSAVSNAGLDFATRDALLSQLRPGGSAAIRLIGSSIKGTRFAPSVIERIGKATRHIAGEGFLL